MLPDYADIMERIPEPPKWWDENGVPRYCDFAPANGAIYAEECCLLLVECQRCRREFQVCVSQHYADRFNAADPQHPFPTLTALVQANNVEYGDPPYVGCCNAGPTMTSVPMRVIEFWRRDRDSRTGEWVRVPELEKDVKPDWAI